LDAISTPAVAPRQEASTDVARAIWNWRAGKSDQTGAQAAHARREGLLRAAIGLAVAAAVWLVWKAPIAPVIGGVSAAVGLLALLSPLGAYRLINRAIAALGRGIATGVTWLLMPIVYYLLFLPVGVLLRARGRLRMKGGPEKGLASYWIATDRPHPAESYERQF